MHFKTLVFLPLLLFFALNVHAGLNCDLLKLLDDPKLADNAQFWEEYSALAANKKAFNDRSLSELLKKHQVEAPPTAKAAPESIIKEPLAYFTSKRADKEIAALTNNVRENYKEFMKLMSDKSGIKALYENPGKWHFEKIKQVENGHTVRLNGGVRVLFRLENNEITVLEVNAARVHAI